MMAESGTLRFSRVVTSADEAHIVGEEEKTTQSVWKWSIVLQPPKWLLRSSGQNYLR